MNALDRITNALLRRYVSARVRPHVVTVIGTTAGVIAAYQIVQAAERRLCEITQGSLNGLRIGARLILCFAAMSASLHRELVDRGIAPHEAIQLVAEIGRRTYKPLWQIPWRLARLLTQDSVECLGMTVKLFRLFPFRSPDYDMRQRTFPDGRVSLDVRRCPAVALFEQLQVPHLCRPLVCDLDFELAQVWRAQLERRETLADGDYECDFRWSPLPPFGSSGEPVY